MAWRNFSTYSKAQLEAALASLEAEQMAGSVIMSGGSGDANYNKQIQTSIRARINMIRWDLHVLDPETYPADFVRGATTTQARFGQTGNGL